METTFDDGCVSFNQSARAVLLTFLNELPFPLPEKLVALVSSTTFTDLLIPLTYQSLLIIPPLPGYTPVESVKCPGPVFVFP